MFQNLKGEGARKTIMTKNQLSKVDREVVNSLKSKNRAIVLNAINNFRNKGNAKLVPYILDLLIYTDDEEIKEKIISLLNDMKDQTVVPVIIAAIESEKYEEVLPELLSSCWQSGLNYEEYYGFFTNIVIDSSYAYAIEAFSVIEQCVDKFAISDKIRMEQKELIESRIKHVDQDKAALLRELIKVYTK